ncbi:phosphotyrosine protein phosphatase [Nakamurella flava]|uniref:Phosphotyrosine protein phosphatase n=1 Tax=Nakamurella flava TaxID=2576308 RepID=A0A4U6QGF1_9ACTN|nr:phosphotyrosine protein phosphatase [Nakamurella flava]
MRVLFVCSRNRLRSPTAEAVFRDRPGIEVASVGLKPDAEEVATPEDIAWADLIFVMEASHKRELTRRFQRYLRDKRVVVLAIRDDYDYLQPELVDLLQRVVPPHLP